MDKVMADNGRGESERGVYGDIRDWVPMMMGVGMLWGIPLTVVGIVDLAIEIAAHVDRGWEMKIAVGVLGLSVLAGGELIRRREVKKMSGSDEIQ